MATTAPPVPRTGVQDVHSSPAMVNKNAFASQTSVAKLQNVDKNTGSLPSPEPSPKQDDGVTPPALRMQSGTATEEFSKTDASDYKQSQQVVQKKDTVSQPTETPGPTSSWGWSGGWSGVVSALSTAVDSATVTGVQFGKIAKDSIDRAIQVIDPDQIRQRELGASSSSLPDSQDTGNEGNREVASTAFKKEESSQDSKSASSNGSTAFLSLERLGKTVDNTLDFTSNAIESTLQHGAALSTKARETIDKVAHIDPQHSKKINEMLHGSLEAGNQVMASTIQMLNMLGNKAINLIDDEDLSGPAMPQASGEAGHELNMLTETPQAEVIIPTSQDNVITESEK